MTITGNFYITLITIYVCGIAEGEGKGGEKRGSRERERNKYKNPTNIYRTGLCVRNATNCTLFTEYVEWPWESGSKDLK